MPPETPWPESLQTDDYPEGTTFKGIVVGACLGAGIWAIILGVLGTVMGWWQ
jgi:hypothetical protein